MGKRNNVKAEEMYELYKQGASLRTIAEVYKISNQAIWMIFKRRNWKMRTCSWLPFIIWKRKKYSLRSNGYYARTTKERGFLHRDKWEFYNGKIPRGFQIHHKDGNKSNNDINNLELISEIEHSLHHLHTCPKCGYKFGNSSEEASTDACE